MTPELKRCPYDGGCPSLNKVEEMLIRMESNQRTMIGGIVFSIVAGLVGVIACLV